MIEPKSRVVLSPSVYIREFGDELVLLDFGKGEYYALDAIGSVILRRLEAGASVGEVTDTLVGDYDVARDDALVDVAALLDQLKEHALIEVLAPEGV